MQILVFSYSQSGQLDEIIRKLVKPLSSNTIEYVRVVPKAPFPFPWTSSHIFFDAMPETVLEKSIDIEIVPVPIGDYDLIILGYQPWFLSPSLPISSLLQSDLFKNTVKGKPVISVIGARNMWMNSQLSINKYIADAGGVMVGNIPVCDTNNNYVSAATILYWMLTTRKDRMWGIFPPPGVQQKEIDGMGVWGEIIEAHLQSNNLPELQKSLMDAGAIKVPTNILFIEKRAKKIFKVWARIIGKRPKGTVARGIWISAFTIYLFIALFLVAPVVLLIYNILFLPFLFPMVRKEKKRIMMNDFKSL